MWQFLFLDLLIISIGVILLIVIRLLPRLDERPVNKGVMERWLTSDLPERMDAFFNAIYVRTLRRVKVLVLRTDNALTKKMASMKLERDEPIAGERLDIKRMTEKAPVEIGEETGTE
jgi:hypothetical protein